MFFPALSKFCGTSHFDSGYLVLSEEEVKQQKADPNNSIRFSVDEGCRIHHLKSSLSLMKSMDSFKQYL